ncbi:hypothetical protein F862_gp017 [Vibrio phage vB_VpaS_MAR10]|uniref:Uncharacterized protein n=1 Tax=Vibrio phage vB_VpaS_MAR10 TaxID=1229755 RepID=K7R2E1_9CAUD|nr:hypothetical protein F862_gp017 [Vibrio phage vB_VpaS_MAR10]AFV81249.1 hypothetical protein MAR10_017 [Vibrio phage vB_VpaS_MAR10]
MRFSTITVGHKYSKWVAAGMELSHHNLAPLLSAAVKPTQRIVSMTYHDRGGMGAHYDIVLENYEVPMVDNVQENYEYYRTMCANNWQTDPMLNPNATDAISKKPARRSRK